MKIKPIPEPALNILARCRVEGAAVYLPEGQLDRKLYEAVNAALEAIGGKWSRKARAHIFTDDAAEALDGVIQSGGYVNLKQALGFFETPPALATRLVDAARLQPEDRILEGSAGTGNLLRAMLASRDLDGDGVADISVTIFEVNPQHKAALVALVPSFYSAELTIGDFLAQELKVHDAAILNPPFAKQADIDHVLHAFSALRPGGRLAAIMSAGTAFRENKTAVNFRALVEAKGGEIERLPDDSFAVSGTGVSTVLVTMTA